MVGADICVKHSLVQISREYMVWSIYLEKYLLLHISKEILFGVISGEILFVAYIWKHIVCCRFLECTLFGADILTKQCMVQIYGQHDFWFRYLEKIMFGAGILSIH